MYRKKTKITTATITKQINNPTTKQNRPSPSLSHALHEMGERVIEAGGHRGRAWFHGHEPPIRLRQRLALRTQSHVQEHLRQHLQEAKKEGGREGVRIIL